MSVLTEDGARALFKVAPSINIILCGHSPKFAQSMNSATFAISSTHYPIGWTVDVKEWITIAWHFNSEKLALPCRTHPQGLHKSSIFSNRISKVVLSRGAAE